MKVSQPKLPFKVELRNPFIEADEYKSRQRYDYIFQEYVRLLKDKARKNLESNEQLRVAWSARFKRPMFDHFDEYTPELAMLEAWEQFYYENPDHLEMKGIHKMKNAKTGYTYYKTGDSTIDRLEEAFSRGETPDLEAEFGDIKGGSDIFRENIFVHQHESAEQGFEAGQKVAPRTGYQGVKEDASGAKLTVAGTKIQHDDYKSDQWLKEALEEDPVLKMMAEKMGVTDA